MMERNIDKELEIVFAQSYDGTIKRDRLANDALSFEKEFQAYYFSKMNVFMQSQNAHEVMNI